MPQTAYKGDVTSLGTSNAIRFEADMFRQHPEFRSSSAVEAHVLGPGTLLVRVVPAASPASSPLHEDGLITAFLSFLEADMARDPGAIAPLSAGMIGEATALTAGVVVADDHGLPDEVTL
jgi:hypothetical protein